MNFWFELLKVYVLTWLFWIVRWHQYFLAFLVVPLKLNLTKSLFNILMVPYLNHHDHWLVVSTPLKNDGLRQLGWWNSQLNGKIKNVPNHQPVIQPSTRCDSMQRHLLQVTSVLLRPSPSRYSPPKLQDSTGKHMEFHGISHGIIWDYMDFSPVFKIESRISPQI